MSIHIIIDGYNLIRQSTTLSTLDQQDIMLGREALVDMLAAYRKIKPHRITVVFDGRSSPVFSPQRNRLKGIALRFSRSGESADDVIKRMAHKEREKALVVSSDREVADSAAANGAATISSQEFEAKIEMAAHFDSPIGEAEESQGWTPTTRKKGPSRRLPKKQRRNRMKIKKL
ncbi:MAG: NYN domain-containing protein [Desulfobacterales bacterium]|jgi:predicted RNA-binding protein with PIN domain|nr:NYN domain-containing protein [Desulfobacterales bacterium]MDH3826257.1 NYN domain-containing protein [Desulfobacterales bacterium]